MAWKFQTFAKDYKEGITLAYYCSNLLLTIALFGIVTIYLRHRDRRDQQRREREDREYQDRRAQEDRRDQERREQEDRRGHQRREWRQFAERIYGVYSKLRSECILQKVLTVKSTFENIRIHSEVTGLDVLRYMLADVNCQNFVSESPQLKALLEDLHTIFLPLHVCSSLPVSGEVPENISLKEELRHVVDEMGNVAKPFFTGNQRRIVLKCLQHFDSGRSNDETEKTEERRVSRLDPQLETIVPYVNILQFGGTNRIQKEQQGFSPKPNLYGGFQGGTSKTAELLNTPGYSQCSKFSLNVKVNNLDNNITFLEELHKDLEDPMYLVDFARKFKEQQAVPLQSIEQISDSDSDESVLMKMLHEVRVYIHLFLNEDLNEDQRVQSNMNRLRQVYGEVKEFRPNTVHVVQGICSQIIEDLEGIHRCPPDHCKNEEFCEKLKELHGRLDEIQKIPRLGQSENNQETSETTL